MKRSRAELPGGMASRMYGGIVNDPASADTRHSKVAPVTPMELCPLKFTITPGEPPVHATCMPLERVTDCAVDPFGCGLVIVGRVGRVTVVLNAGTSTPPEKLRV